ncbi:MAG: DUF3817 domain-containing protein [Myxococcota bacterium]
MTLVLGFRLAKLVGLALFGAGCIGAALAREPRDRATFAYGLATAGWLASWLAGYGLMKSVGLKMSEPWLAAGMGFSFAALLGAVLSAQGTRNPVWAGLSVGGLCGAVASMTLRSIPSVLPWAAGAAAVGFAVTAAIVAFRPDGTGAFEPRRAVGAWFDWMGRLEGLSLLALFGVYMPAKYALHIELDGGQGWFGWVHGMLFVSYLVALASVTRVAGWPLTRAAMAFAASLVPFGTFVFEARSKAWRT